MARGLKCLCKWLLVLPVALLTACGGSDDKPAAAAPPKKTITLLTMQLRPTFDEYFKPVIADFEAAHPGFTVQWQDAPFQDYETKLTTALIGSAPPDVINLPQESVGDFVAAGQLLALDDRLSADTRGAYVPRLLEEGGTFDGKVYALPWYAVSDVTLVNTELMAQAGLADRLPRHYTEIPEICRTVKEKTGAFGYFPLYTETGYLRQYLLDAGVPLLNDDGTKAAFNTPKGVEVLTWWSDLYRQKLVPSEALTATHRRPLELYQSGRLAVLYTAPQFLRTIRTEAPDIYAKTKVLPRLQWPDHERYNVSLHMLCVSAKSAHGKESAELAALITDARRQLEFSKLTTTMPSVTEALRDPWFRSSEATPEAEARNICAGQVEKGSVWRAPRNGRELNRIVEEIMEKTASGELEPAAALTQAEARWNEALRK